MSLVKAGNSEGWESASLLPRGKDAFGNDTLLFGEEPIRAVFPDGGRPLLAIKDVLGVCGLKRSTPQDQLDVRGASGMHPFKTPGGVQQFRLVDLDDAYRIAMQGRSAECRTFRDFLIELLRKIERGETINLRPAPAAAGGPDEGPLVRQAILLLDVARKSAEHTRQIAELRADADRAEARRLADDRAMRALPPPSAPIPGKSRIDLTEQLIRFWCGENGGDFKLAYNRFYEEVKRRMGYDVKKRRKKYKDDRSCLDVMRAEPPEHMTLPEFHDSVYSLANDMFRRDLRVVGDD